VDDKQNLILVKNLISKINSLERACKKDLDLHQLQKIIAKKSRLIRELEQTLGSQGIYLPKTNDSSDRVLC